MLLRAAERRGSVYVLLTMRSDFLGECAEHPGLPEAINRGQYLVPRLTRSERRAAIAQPARVAGASVSAPLVTRLLNELGDDPDQLSLLQHALNRAWAHWQSTGNGAELDLHHYEAVGGIAGALEQQAEHAYEGLTPRAQLAAEKLFRALSDSVAGLWRARSLRSRTVARRHRAPGG